MAPTATIIASLTDWEMELDLQRDLDLLEALDTEPGTGLNFLGTDTEPSTGPNILGIGITSVTMKPRTETPRDPASARGNDNRTSYQRLVNIPIPKPN